MYAVLHIKEFHFRADGNGPTSPVLAGPVFLKVKNKVHFYKKASNKQKCYGDFWTC